MPRSNRPLLAASLACGLAAAMALPSCMDTEGYADSSVELCDLLRACYGYPNCDHHVGGALDAAGSSERASWLASLTDKSCLSQCSAARRCLNIPPVCLEVGEGCSRAEDCCGFLAGKVSCAPPPACVSNDGGAPDPDAGDCSGKCCKADGASCTDQEQHLCCSGFCDPRTTTCGGKRCKEVDQYCQIDADCCTEKCDQAQHICLENICTPKGSVCNKETDTCCDGTQCQVLGGGTQGICDLTAGCRGEDEPCVAENALEEEKCCKDAAGSEVLCVTTGEVSPDGRKLGICSEKKCLPDGESCGGDGSCCSGFCDIQKKYCAKPCGAEGDPCTQPFECCGGVCNNGACECSKGSCQRNDDCCSKTCVAGACAPECAATHQCHDECKTGGPMDPAANCPNYGPPGLLENKCVRKICEGIPPEPPIDPYCCCVKWDDLCVTEVLKTCTENFCG